MQHRHGICACTDAYIVKSHKATVLSHVGLLYISNTSTEDEDNRKETVQRKDKNKKKLSMCHSSDSISLVGGWIDEQRKYVIANNCNVGYINPHKAFPCTFLIQQTFNSLITRQKNNENNNDRARQNHKLFDLFPKGE